LKAKLWVNFTSNLAFTTGFLSAVSFIVAPIIALSIWYSIGIVVGGLFIFGVIFILKGLIRLDADTKLRKALGYLYFTIGLVFTSLGITWLRLNGYEWMIQHDWGYLASWLHGGGIGQDFGMVSASFVIPGLAGYALASLFIVLGWLVANFAFLREMFIKTSPVLGAKIRQRIYDRISEKFSKELPNIRGFIDRTKPSEKDTEELRKAKEKEVKEAKEALMNRIWNSLSDRNERVLLDAAKNGSLAEAKESLYEEADALSKRSSNIIAVNVLENRAYVLAEEYMVRLYEVRSRAKGEKDKLSSELWASLTREEQDAILGIKNNDEAKAKELFYARIDEIDHARFMRQASALLAERAGALAEKYRGRLLGLRKRPNVNDPGAPALKANLIEEMWNEFNKNEKKLIAVANDETPNNALRSKDEIYRKVNWLIEEKNDQGKEEISRREAEGWLVERTRSLAGRFSKRLREWRALTRTGDAQAQAQKDALVEDMWQKLDSLGFWGVVGITIGFAGLITAPFVIFFLVKVRGGFKRAAVLLTGENMNNTARAKERLFNEVNKISIDNSNELLFKNVRYLANKFRNEFYAGKANLQKDLWKALDKFHIIRFRLNGGKSAAIDLMASESSARRELYNVVKREMLADSNKKVHKISQKLAAKFYKRLREVRYLTAIKDSNVSREKQNLSDRIWQSLNREEQGMLVYLKDHNRDAAREFLYSETDKASKRYSKPIADKLLNWQTEFIVKRFYERIREIRKAMSETEDPAEKEEIEKLKAGLIDDIWNDLDNPEMMALVDVKGGDITIAKEALYAKFNDLVKSESAMRAEKIRVNISKTLAGKFAERIERLEKLANDGNEDADTVRNELIKDMWSSLKDEEQDVILDARDYNLAGEDSEKYIKLEKDMKLEKNMKWELYNNARQYSRRVGTIKQLFNYLAPEGAVQPQQSPQPPATSAVVMAKANDRFVLATATVGKIDGTIQLLSYSAENTERALPVMDVEKAFNALIRKTVTLNGFSMDARTKIEAMIGNDEAKRQELLNGKMIRIVTGNDRLMHFTEDANMITIDADALLYNDLLFLEFIHELMHAKSAATQTRAGPLDANEQIREEIEITTKEVGLFLTLRPDVQAESINILASKTNTLDDKEFCRILEKAVAEKSVTPLVQEEIDLYVYTNALISQYAAAEKATLGLPAGFDAAEIDKVKNTIDKPYTDILTIQPEVKGMDNAATAGIFAAAMALKDEAGLTDEEAYLNAAEDYHVAVLDTKGNLNDAEKAAVREIAAATSPFNITFQGLIVTKDGAIIAKGYVDTTGIFRMRQALVDAGVTDAKSRPKQFVHLTLGRITKPVAPEKFRRLLDAVSKLNEKKFGAWNIKAIKTGDCPNGYKPKFVNLVTLPLTAPRLVTAAAPAISPSMTGEEIWQVLNNPEVSRLPELKDQVTWRDPQTGVPVTVLDHVRNLIAFENALSDEIRKEDGNPAKIVAGRKDRRITAPLNPDNIQAFVNYYRQVAGSQGGSYKLMLLRIALALHDIGKVNGRGEDRYGSLAYSRPVIEKLKADGVIRSGADAELVLALIYLHDTFNTMHYGEPVPAEIYEYLGRIDDKKKAAVDKAAYCELAPLLYIFDLGAVGTGVVSDNHLADFKYYLTPSHIDSLIAHWPQIRLQGFSAEGFLPMNFTAQDYSAAAVVATQEGIAPSVAALTETELDPDKISPAEYGNLQNGILTNVSITGHAIFILRRLNKLSPQNMLKFLYLLNKIYESYKSGELAFKVALFIPTENDNVFGTILSETLDKVTFKDIRDIFQAGAPSFGELYKRFGIPFEIVANPEGKTLLIHTGAANVQNIAKNLAAEWGDPAFVDIHERARQMVSGEIPFTMEAYSGLLKDYKEYLLGTDEQKAESAAYHMQPDRRIVYFSMEYALYENTFAGGLGFLSGDDQRGKSDMYAANTCVAVGLGYRRGYCITEVGAGGEQIEYYPEVPLERYGERVKDAEGNDIVIKLEMPEGDAPIYATAWRVRIGRTELYQLDTDIDLNDENTRKLTHNLYAEDPKDPGRVWRFKQEYLLGVGGIRLLEKLGIRPAAMHLNEGHAGLAAIELIKSELESRATRLAAANGISIEKGTGLREVIRKLIENKQVDRSSINFESARKAVAARIGFTSHTPIPEGNEEYPAGVFGKYFGYYCWFNGIQYDDLTRIAIYKSKVTGEDTANLSELVLAISSESNAVSDLNAKVAKELYDEPGMYGITNAVHRGFVQAKSLQDLLDEKLEYLQSQGLLTGRTLDKLSRDEALTLLGSIGTEEMINTKREMKAAGKAALVAMHRAKRNAAVEFLAQYWHLSKQETENRLFNENLEGISVDDNTFTIVLARRMASYKRLGLILGIDNANSVDGEDFEDQYLSELIKKADGKGLKVQIIFAGKANPYDEKGKAILAKIHKAIMKPAVPDWIGKIFFVPDYDPNTAKYLMMIADIWQSNPLRPLEASETSFMKALDNMALDVSTPDGSMLEDRSAFLFGNSPELIREYEELQIIKKARGEDNPEYRKKLKEIQAKELPELMSLYERLMDMYKDKEAWAENMRKAVAEGISYFNMPRFSKEYKEKMYMNLVRRGQEEDAKFESVLNEAREAARRSGAKQPEAGPLATQLGRGAVATLLMISGAYGLIAGSKAANGVMQAGLGTIPTSILIVDALFLCLAFTIFYILTIAFKGFAAHPTRAGPGIIIGVTSEAMRDTAWHKVSMSPLIVIVRDVVIVDNANALSKIAKEKGAVGVFIDNSIPFASMSNDQVVQEIATIKLTQNYNIILHMTNIDNTLRDEIAATIKAILDKLGPVDIDAAVAMLRGGAASRSTDIAEDLAKLQTLVSNRKSNISVKAAYYAPLAIDKAEITTKAVVPVTTEQVAVASIYNGEEMAEAAEQGMVNYVIYGDIAKNKKEAEAMTKAAGYAGPSNMVDFIDKRDYASYDELKAAIIARASKALGREIREANIGIRAAAGELLKKGEKPGAEKFLEVQDVEMNGTKVLGAMGSYQVLINMVLGKELPPEVIPDSVRGVFKYLPRALPIDYGREIETYRNAILLISAAA